MKSTRGYGFLENFLAKQRASLADRLIPEEYRKGRILDIGCGDHPFYLMQTRFAEKYGLNETFASDLKGNGIFFKAVDIEKEDLPFRDDFFNVVTMLAVFEHVSIQRLPVLIDEIYRVLKPGGILVITTPPAWTDGLLKILARFKIVSSIEILDHKDTYTHKKIGRIFSATRFYHSPMKAGFFECFMNLYAVIQKT